MEKMKFTGSRSLTTYFQLLSISEWSILTTNMSISDVLIIIKRTHKQTPVSLPHKLKIIPLKTQNWTALPNQMYKTKKLMNLPMVVTASLSLNGVQINNNAWESAPMTTDLLELPYSMGNVSAYLTTTGIQKASNVSLIVSQPYPKVYTLKMLKNVNATPLQSGMNTSRTATLNVPRSSTLLVNMSQRRFASVNLLRIGIHKPCNVKSIAQTFILERQFLKIPTSCSCSPTHDWD